MDIERLKETLITLLHINEVYPNEQEVINYVLYRLKEAGVHYVQDSFSNIIARIPGKGEPIVLSTHLDIPESVPNLQYSVQGDYIHSDGNGILGVDPKTGLAILLELADALVAQEETSHRPVELFITRGEEAGLMGARNADYALLEAKKGLVLDQDGPVTEVVTRAPSYISLNGECIGKAAHPREPEQGVNALEAACKTLADFPWGFSKSGVTWNIGLLEAGTAVNTIPGSVSFQSELRGYDHEEVLSEARRLTQQVKDYEEVYNVTWNITVDVEFVGYHITKQNTLLTELDEVYKALNLSPRYFETFGGTDANIMNAHGIEALPIGSGYYNAHQYSEYASFSDMKQIGEFLLKYLAMDL